MKMDFSPSALAVVVLIVIAIACGTTTHHDVDVKGGTSNSVTVDEQFCDKETYPSVAERRACKDALLAALSAECTKSPRP